MFPIPDVGYVCQTPHISLGFVTRSQYPDSDVDLCIGLITSNNDADLCIGLITSNTHIHHHESYRKKGLCSLQLQWKRVSEMVLARGNLESTSSHPT